MKRRTYALRIGGAPYKAGLNHTEAQTYARCYALFPDRDHAGNAIPIELLREDTGAVLTTWR